MEALLTNLILLPANGANICLQTHISFERNNLLTLHRELFLSHLTVSVSGTMKNSEQLSPYFEKFSFKPIKHTMTKCIKIKQRQSFAAVEGPNFSNSVKLF